VFLLTDGGDVYTRWIGSEEGWVQLDIPDYLTAISFAEGTWMGQYGNWKAKIVLTDTGEIWLDVLGDDLDWEQIPPPPTEGLSMIAHGTWIGPYDSYLPAIFVFSDSGEIFVLANHPEANWESLGFPDGGVPVKGTSWGGLKSRFE